MDTFFDFFLHFARAHVICLPGTNRKPAHKEENSHAPATFYFMNFTNFITPFDFREIRNDKNVRRRCQSAPLKKTFNSQVVTSNYFVTLPPENF